MPGPQVRTLVGEDGGQLVVGQGVEDPPGQDDPRAPAGDAVGGRGGVLEHHDAVVVAHTEDVDERPVLRAGRPDPGADEMARHQQPDDDGRTDEERQGDEPGAVGDSLATEGRREGRRGDGHRGQHPAQRDGLPHGERCARRPAQARAAGQDPRRHPHQGDGEPGEGEREHRTIVAVPGRAAVSDPAVAASRGRGTCRWPGSPLRRGPP